MSISRNIPSAFLRFSRAFFSYPHSDTTRPEIDTLGIVMLTFWTLHIRVPGIERRSGGIPHLSLSPQRSEGLLCLFQVGFGPALLKCINSLGKELPGFILSPFPLVQETKSQTGLPQNAFGSDFPCH